MQMTPLMNNLGSVMKLLEETSVNSKDLYYNLTTDPIVTEKSDAKDFEFKKGKIKFENVNFRHLKFDDSSMEVPKES